MKMNFRVFKLCQNLVYLSIKKNAPKAGFSSSSARVFFKPQTHGLDEEALKELTKTGRAVAVKNLVELFGLSKYEALNCVLKYTNLEKVPGRLIQDNYNFCLKNGLSNDTFKKFSGILAEDDLDKKVYLLKKLDCDINKSSPLLFMEYDALSKLIGTQVKRDRFMKRLDKFTEIFECSIEVICETFLKRKFLRDISLTKLEENVNILKRNGITIEEIMDDWWVLKYNSSTIQERIDIAVDNNINAKTWMVRAKSEIFEKYLKRRSDNLLILGDSTVTEYLAEKLECSTQEAKYILTRLPALNKKSLKKLEELINFLYAEGFKPSHICRLPNVLLHSVDTMRQRIRELEKQKVKLDSLHLLIKSRKQYLQYYTALVKANRKKIKVVDT